MTQQSYLTHRQEGNTLILNYRTPLVFSSTHHNRSQGFCFVFDMVMFGPCMGIGVDGERKVMS